jgi:hypothetical protein
MVALGMQSTDNPDGESASKASIAFDEAQLDFLRIAT